MRKAALTLILSLALYACGGDGESSSSTSRTGNSTTGFYAPEYGDATGNTAYESNLDGITSRVIQYQDKGKELTRLIPDSSGLIQLIGDLKVRLIEMTKNACPSGISGCNTTDSQALGVGKSALIEDFSDLGNSVRNQDERGTCVAFALNAAMEILLGRQQDTDDLAEQNTYFEGKRQTDTWNSAGLSPYSTISKFVDNKAKIVAEKYWPYNREQEQCDNYWAQYPNATCSETEAQGGGSDYKTQDPSAASAGGYRIETAHQLYASVGRIKQAIYRGYPVIIAINANYDFLLATQKGGVVSWVFKIDDCGSSVCGHAVTAVGYQDDDRVAGGGYLIIKNSWSQEWGDGGLAYVTYEWLEHSLLDAQALVAYKTY